MGHFDKGKMASDRINILHQEFSEFTGSAFNVLYSDHEFTDVTIVCDEDKQVEAHKVILSSSSKFFRRILLRNPHQHPLIYLKGVAYENLEYILQFIYLGQIELSTDNLTLFIETAKELEINGLTDAVFGKEEPTENTSTQENGYNKEPFTHIEKDFKPEMSESLIFTTANESDISMSETPLDITTKVLQCDQCTETFPGKSELKKHIRTIHEGLSYPFTHGERVSRWRKRKLSMFSEDSLKEMNKAMNQKKSAELKARRMEDKEFDKKLREQARERTRRSREKKALETALANKNE